MRRKTAAIVAANKNVGAFMFIFGVGKKENLEPKIDLYFAIKKKK
jgi:hypothetical protein